MISKTLNVFTCILAACLMLSACAPAPTPTAAPTTAPASSAAASMAASSAAASMAASSAAASMASSAAAGQIDCMGAKSGDTLTLVYQWSGAEEESFNNVIKPFVDACGVKITPQSTRDDAVLDTLVKSSPPDVLFWPNLSPLKLYTDKLVALDTVGANKDNYASYWIEMGTSGGKWLVVPAKADVKSIIWYSPTQFQALNYTVPTSFDDLKTLAGKMSADGNVPWSMGFNNGGAANGWAGTDFIQDILLATQGPDYVNKLISGEVPYNDQPVVDAYKLYYSWASDPKFAVGGANGTVNTKFLDSIYKVFANPPEAMMVKISGFAGGEIVKQYPTLKYGTDFDFFEFPGVKGVQGSADFMYAFSDKPAAKALIAYITSTGGGAAWAKAGFGLSPNKAAAGNYPDAQSTKLGDILANASGFTFDIGDGLGAPFNDAEFKAVNDIVQGADIKTTLDTVAAAQAKTVGK
jgi:alpha-glucoside transport system substrate-binding protein